MEIASESKMAQPGAAHVDEDTTKQLVNLKETLDNIERMHYLIKTLKIEHSLFSIQVARATDDYFDLTYE